MIIQSSWIGGVMGGWMDSHGAVMVSPNPHTAPTSTNKQKQVRLPLVFIMHLLFLAFSPPPSHQAKPNNNKIP